MAASTRGQDEANANPVFWLAIRVDKIGPSFPLRIVAPFDHARKKKTNKQTKNLAWSGLTMLVIFKGKQKAVRTK